MDRINFRMQSASRSLTLERMGVCVKAEWLADNINQKLAMLYREWMTPKLSLCKHFSKFKMGLFWSKIQTFSTNPPFCQKKMITPLINTQFYFPTKRIFSREIVVIAGRIFSRTFKSTPDHYFYNDLCAITKSINTFYFCKKKYLLREIT